jgi:RNA polymerase sigma-70 factor, ECF subfamily
MGKGSRVGVWREVGDESLMARYADGDSEAFEELFRRYEPCAYAFFVKRTGSRERAEDLYQELFLRIHRARDAYDPARPFSPWFYQIAHRLLVDDIRRAFRNREVPLDARDLRSGSSDVERELADRDELRHALAGLSPGERYVLVSAKVGGEEYSEVAERVGKSTDAVKKVASRAMQRIRSSQALGSARPIKLHSD